MTVKELEKISADKADLIKVRKIVREQAEELAKNTGYRKQVLVCGGTGCTSSRSLKNGLYFLAFFKGHRTARSFF